MAVTTDPALQAVSFQSVDALMRRALADGVFPGGVLCVAESGEIRFHRPYGVRDLDAGQPVTLDTVYDLASLTKPLATTLAIVKLIEQNRLGLDQTLGEILEGFRGTGKSGVTIRQLLDHTSGLPDYRPYYIELAALSPERRPAVFQNRLAAEPLAHPAGGQTVYSDLGFMLLGMIVETVSGNRLDRFLGSAVYDPLGISDLFFVDLAGERPEKPFAATETCPWRRRTICGEVHDDNAWAMGGVCGHAGLFGTAAGVLRLLTALMDAAWEVPGPAVLPVDLVRRFLIPASGADRALGFDVPSPEGSASGCFFSPGSVGHLGFTGTSFWMDMKRRIVVILLTNRVHPSRDNVGIKAFRPKLHDAVMGCLLSVGPPAH